MKDKAEKLLEKVWVDQERQDQYVKALHNAGSGLQVAVLASKLVSYLAANKCEDNLKKVREFVKETVTKVSKPTSTGDSGSSCKV